MLAFILLVVLSAVVCSCSARPWQYLEKYMYPDRLEAFYASDGDYFPDFIYQTFEKAHDFSRKHKTIREAKSGIKFIQVKKLNLDNASAHEANLNWSADGAYLGYEVTQGYYRKILLKNMVGNFSRELQVIKKKSDNFLEGLVIDSVKSYNSGLSWSKKSNQYAFMSNGISGNYDIHVGKIGRPEKPQIRSSSNDGYATWSPNTDELAFVSGRSNSGDIYVYNLANKKLTQVTKSVQIDLFPDWHPDGNLIFYSSGSTFFHNIYTAHRDFKDRWIIKPFTDWSRDNLKPKVSPDGRHVAFYANSDVGKAEREQQWNIIVVPTQVNLPYNSNYLKKQIVAKNVVIDLSSGPAWSPDGKKIFYVRKQPSMFNPIFCFDLTQGKSMLLKTRTKMNRDLTMSPLGVLSFRSQVGAWDKVFVALTNQGKQLQNRQ